METRYCGTIYHNDAGTGNGDGGEEQKKKKKKKQKKKQRVAYKRRKTKYDKICIYQTQQFGWS